jgi:hypothetical protein
MMKAISITWTVADVQALDASLSEAEAAAVLADVADRYNPALGIGTNSILIAIRELPPLDKAVERPSLDD